MKKIILACLLALQICEPAYAADVKISQLPLGSAATAGVNDSFPYIQATTNITKRLTLWDLINLPPMVSTYAPKANPTFTGVVTAPSFVGPLTGNASTATALAANPTDCASNTFANAIVANGNLTCAAVGDAALSSSYVKADGTRALTGSWNAGAFSITANSVGVGSAANTINGLSTTINGSGTLNHNSTGTITIPNATDTLVGKATTDTLTNKTLTAPVISSIVNTGTLTLPTSTDTLVGRATTDTLTNKTLTAPVISSIVNTGTLTLPTSTDTLVGKATTDTLTNKTIAAGSNTISGLTNSNLSGSAGITIANGGTGAATKAAAFDALSPMSAGGDLIYGGASGTGTRLANGTAGQVLTSQGGTSAPTWSGAGAMTLLLTQTASSSASLVFSSTYITSTYKSYKFILRNVLPATNAVNLLIDFSTNNGSTYVGSPNFYFAFQYSRNDAATGGGGGGATGTCGTFINLGNTSTWGANYEMDLYDPSNSTTYKNLNFNGNYIDNTSLVLTQNGNCGIAVTTAINAMKFSFSSGNIASGTISLYGVSQ